MKFLSLSLGLSAATSRCPCPYCCARKPKAAIALTEEEEEVEGEGRKKKKRTKKEKADDVAGDWYDHLKHRAIERNSWDDVVGGSTGQFRSNLLCFIPFWRVIIDVLHLHLRISDRIYHCALDKILKLRFVSKKSDASKTKLIEEQTDWLNKHVAPHFQAVSHVSNLHFVHKQGNWCTSRLGDGAARLINKNLCFTELLSDPKHLATAAEMQKNLSGFVKLYDVINTAFAPPHPEEHRGAAKAWLHHAIAVNKDGKSLYPASFLTPYVHVFTHHVGELLASHGEIYTFSGQALERANGRHSAAWQRANSRRKGEQNLAIIMASFRSMFNQPLDATGAMPPTRCPVLDCRCTFVYARALSTHLSNFHDDEDVTLDNDTLVLVEQVRRDEHAKRLDLTRRQTHLEQFVMVSVARQKEEDRELAASKRVKRKLEKAERGGDACWEISQKAAKKSKSTRAWGVKFV
jgi:hypothetical protein